MGAPGHGPERLRVFQLALQLAAEVDAAVAATRCIEALAGQSARAADSVVLNIAEGAGHFTPGRKANFYRFAHGSTYEVIGALLRMRQIRPGPEVTRALRTAHMVGTMLNALIRAQSLPTPPDPAPPEARSS
jgi:four helix bundle protein